MTAVNNFVEATLQERLPGIHDQVIEECALLRKLKERGRIITGCGGDGFRFPARYQSSGRIPAVGDWSPGTARTTRTVQTVEGQYAAYADALLINRFQKKRNEYAGQESKIFDQFVNDLNEFEQAFQSTLGTDVYADGSKQTGDEGDPLTGLEAIIATANTYLGIARSANSWWRAQSQSITNPFLDDDDGDGVTNGVAAMMALMTAVMKHGEQRGEDIAKGLAEARVKPDLWICDPDAFLLWWKSQLPQQRYTSKEGSLLEAVSCLGLILEQDTYCTALRFYLTTLKNMSLRVIGPQLIYRDFEDSLGVSGQPRADAVGLASQCQLVCTKPRTQGKLIYVS